MTERFPSLVEKGVMASLLSEGTENPFSGGLQLRIADKDGNNLISIDPNDPEKDELLQYLHYYPSFQLGVLFGDFFLKSSKGALRWNQEWDTPLEGLNGNLLGEGGVENRYSYNGKEHIDDLGINLSDYGARYYDPAIGRFTTIDPGAEIYTGWSPYHYVYNNPIAFIDPTGAIIEDPDGIVKDYRSSINSQISGLNSILNNKNFDYAALGTSKKAVKQLIGELSGIIGELDGLHSSEQVYKVGFSDSMGKNEGGVSFNNGDNSVSIEIGERSNLGVVSQELLHAHQFESGDISIAYNNDAYGSLYDINDETATYRREHLVMQGVAGIESRKAIDNK